MRVKIFGISLSGLLAMLAGCADNGSADRGVTKAPAAVAPVAAPSVPPPADDSWTVLRVGGDMTTQPDFDGQSYRLGKMLINTPLPAGYPAPTPPDAIEIKKYPEVRRAQVTRKGLPDASMNFAFWPLFQHIKRRDIAMTSPVEMDYPGMKGAAPSSADENYEPSQDQWTMAFLYRERDLGPIGADKGGIEIIDAPAVMVASIGFRGGYSITNAKHNLATLEQWLAANPQWERIGEPRVFHYNGPERSSAWRWGEVQVPVRERAQSAATP